ncbi:tetratricopeptide repeat protein [bacterium]|nr:tetratricopeptide repeat protein [bacterium]
MRRCITFATIVVFMFLIGSCSHTVKVPMYRPPQTDIGVKKVFIAQMTGTGGTDLEDRIRDGLLSSGYYDIVSKLQFEKILSSHGMSWSDLNVLNKVVELGRDIGPAAIILGDVSVSEYTEEPVKYAVVVDEDGTRHKLGKRKGTAHLEAHIRILDARTGEKIFYKKFSTERTEVTKAENAPPPPIDGFELLRDCRQEIADMFVSRITPIETIVSLDYEVDDEIPLLEKGYKMVKAKNYDKAIKYFEQATSENGDRWETWWDLGLTYEAAGMHQKADSALTRAYDLFPEDFIAEEIANNKKYMWRSDDE